MIWKVGKINSVVVSDEKVKNTNFPTPPNPSESTDEEIEYYGGYLICESVSTKEHAKLIAAAPDLLEALEAFTDNVDKWLETGVPADKETSKAIYDKAKAAIKKATV